MNVTLSVDARVVAEVRRIAAVRGTTLNQIIRDYLRDLTQHEDILQAMSTAQLRETVAKQLRRSQAHAGLTAALDGFPAELAGKAVAGHPHTAWQQVEHLRLAAEDLVAYCRDAEYAPPEWPAGYWPASPEPPSYEAWSESCRRLLEASDRLARLVEDPDLDLFSAVPTAEKAQHHTLRAALILLDHNGYHVGQIVALRKALGIWPEGQVSAP